MVRQSPAMRMLMIVWEEQGHQMGRSRERFNDTMYAATRLAITGGLEFAPEDFETIAEMVRLGEGLYRVACGMDRNPPNRSACQSFEQWKKRKPFIWHGHRLAVGTRFKWRGEWVTCTSFAEDGASLTACSYRPTTHEDRYRPDKIRHRFTITRAALRAERAAAKKAKEEFGDGDGTETKKSD